MARDIVTVLDALGISVAHYFGYSMGGAIGFWLGKDAPERTHSLILGGASPSTPPNLEFRDAQIAALRNGIEAWVEQAGPVSPKRRSQRLQNDADALLAAQLAFGETPSIEDALGNLNMPCLLFAGEDDQGAYPGIKEDAKRMPTARWFSLPGLVHTAASVRSDLVLPHVTKFLAEVSQAATGQPA